MQQFRDIVASPAGRPIQGATVTVTFSTGGTPTLYSDNGVTALGSNVLTTDANGEYKFYAGNGRYTFTIAASGYTGTTRDVVLYDPVHDRTSVIEYRADPAGAANSTTAIQAALTAGAGGIVDMPEGTFLITDALSIPANTWLRGAGRGTILKCLTLANGGSGIGHRMLDIRAAGVKVTGIAFDAGSMTGFLAGMRCILAIGATGLEISGNHFITSGAATACLDCSDYRITGNTISIASTTGAATHDGIIDQWDGSHDFLISGNTIDGNGIGEWPILVTGTDTAGVAAACFNFTISDNKVYDCITAGIWAMGRNGTVYNFTITGNVIDSVSASYGIAATDCEAFAITGNVVKNTGWNGIRCFSETGAGGTIAAKNGTISGNTIVNANVLGNTSIDPGSAISVTDNSTRVTLSGNVVEGTTHRYAVHFGGSTTLCELIGWNLKPGVVGTVINQETSGSNIIPGGADYIPTLTGVANVTTSASAIIRWDRRGNNVFGSGRFDVTPAVAANTDTQIGISLPVPSAFTGTSDAAGVAASGFGIVGALVADTTNDRLSLRFPAPNTVSNSISFTFSYLVRA